MCVDRFIHTIQIITWYAHYYTDERFFRNIVCESSSLYVHTSFACCVKQTVFDRCRHRITHFSAQFDINTYINIRYEFKNKIKRTYSHSISYYDIFNNGHFILTAILNTVSANEIATTTNTHLSETRAHTQKLRREKNEGCDKSAFFWLFCMYEIKQTEPCVCCSCYFIRTHTVLCCRTTIKSLFILCYVCWCVRAIVFN